MYDSMLSQAGDKLVYKGKQEQAAADYSVPFSCQLIYLWLLISAAPSSESCLRKGNEWLLGY